VEIGAALALVVIAVVVTGIVVIGHLQTTTPVPAGPTPDYRAAVVTSHLPVSLNPLIDSEDPAVAAITPLLYRCLLKLSSTSYPAPDLASQITIGSDGLTYSLSLTPGLRWSNGSAITAQDAVATIQWVQSSSFPDASYASALEGVAASAVGDTLLLKLASPRASLAYTLTELPILPLGSMSSTGLASLATHSTSPLPTSGPYEVDAQQDGVITLVDNPHAALAPHLARVQIEALTSFTSAAQAYAAGTVQAVLATTPAEQAQLLRQAGATSHNTLTFGFVDLLFNEGVPGLDTSAVRTAIADTIDRNAIVKGPVGGLGVTQYGPIPAGIGWLQSEQPPLSANLAAATAGLQDAGFLVTRNGIRGRVGELLQFTLTVPDAAPLPAVAQMVATQLHPMGIAVTVSVVPSATFLNNVLIPGKFQLAIASWGASPDPDLTPFWASTSIPPHGFNVSRGTVDPSLDQDLTTLATATSLAQSTAAAGQVVEQMNQDLPAVFLYAPAESLVINGQSLSNVIVPGAGNPFADAAVWKK
jgi:peptide/nickel transport system substrate-binding protein